MQIEPNQLSQYIESNHIKKTIKSQICLIKLVIGYDSAYRRTDMTYCNKNKNNDSRFLPISIYGNTTFQKQT